MRDPSSKVILFDYKFWFLRRRITQCLACNDIFKCNLEVLRPKDDHYLVVAIRTSYSNANVYLFDELTNEVHFKNYSNYYAGELEKCSTREEVFEIFEL